MLRKTLAAVGHAVQVRAPASCLLLVWCGCGVVWCGTVPVFTISSLTSCRVHPPSVPSHPLPAQEADDGSSAVALIEKMVGASEPSFDVILMDYIMVRRALHPSYVFTPTV